MDTDNFILYKKKADDIYIYMTVDVEQKFNHSNYESDRPLPKEKSRKVVGLMKNELGRKIIIFFFALKAKAYNYLTDDGSEDKKVNSTKTRFMKK